MYCSTKWHVLKKLKYIITHPQTNLWTLLNDSLNNLFLNSVNDYQSKFHLRNN